MIAVAVFVIVALLAGYLLAPVFRSASVPSSDLRAPLEAARAASFRAIRDLELDWATGKLSGDDYRLQRAALEAELAAILRRLRSPEPTL